MPHKSTTKDGSKERCNLSIRKDVRLAVENFILNNRRKGRGNLSELTENLWISYLRGKRVKLPVLLKAAR